ncbi:hypothetical protein DBR17_00395 [Sphingomonas sp. HMWF008]|nr:hypothetical protein DBR17_00395 [Sphingomonas sp. HMWF008]
MRPSLLASELEELFLSEAPATLPMSDVETGRTDHGRLFYRWRSPCYAIECLSFYILDGEVMLSTKIFHDHIDDLSFEVRSQAASQQDLPRLVIRTAINEAAAIMNSERVFTVEYGPSGQPTNYMMSPRHVWEDRANRKTNGPSVVHSWDWQGRAI